jgi:hypothetical protein
LRVKHTSSLDFGPPALGAPPSSIHRTRTILIAALLEPTPRAVCAVFGSLDVSVPVLCCCTVGESTPRTACAVVDSSNVVCTCAVLLRSWNQHRAPSAPWSIRLTWSIPVLCALGCYTVGTYTARRLRRDWFIGRIYTCAVLLHSGRIYTARRLRRG